MSVESEGITRTAAVPDAEGSEVLERSASDGGDASSGWLDGRAPAGPIVLQTAAPNGASLRNIDRALQLFDWMIMFFCGVAVSNALLGQQHVVENLAVSAIAATALLQFLTRSQVYTIPSHLFPFRLLVKIVRSLVFTFVGIIAVAFLVEAFHYSREWVALWFATTLVSMLAYRLCLVGILRVSIDAAHLQQKIAVYGGESKGVSVVRHLRSLPGQQYHVVGFYDDRANRVPDDIEGVPRLGGLEELVEAVQAGQVDEVVLALPLAPVDRLTGIMNRLGTFSVTVYFAPDPLLWQFFDRPFEHIGGAPMLRAIATPMRGWGAVAKFVEDRVIALLLLVLLSPVMLVTAAAIWLETGGPIIFRQPRRGWNGQLFSIYKFRTMRTDMADLAGARQATRNDPRVTKVGALLRRTSIDELPQLINVLNGNMSLVGPRPHALGTKAEGKPFEEAVSNYMVRYRVKPGITGWAQVNGWRGETDTNQKLLGRVRYDIEYIENWSFWLDLYILCITPLSLLVRSKNAY